MGDQSLQYFMQVHYTPMIVCCNVRWFLKVAVQWIYSPCPLVSRVPKDNLRLGTWFQWAKSLSDASVTIESWIVSATGAHKTVGCFQLVCMQQCDHHPKILYYKYVLLLYGIILTIQIEIHQHMITASDTTITIFIFMLLHFQAFLLRLSLFDVFKRLKWHPGWIFIWILRYSLHKKFWKHQGHVHKLKD